MTSKSPHFFHVAQLALGAGGIGETIAGIALLQNFGVFQQYPCTKTKQ
jgi:hypothetical protein